MGWELALLFLQPAGKVSVLCGPFPGLLATHFRMATPTRLFQFANSGEWMGTAGHGGVSA